MSGWFHFPDVPVVEIAVVTEIEADPDYRGRLRTIAPLEGERLLMATGENLDDIGNSLRCYRKHWHRTEAKK